MSPPPTALDTGVNTGIFHHWSLKGLAGRFKALTRETALFFYFIYFKMIRRNGLKFRPVERLPDNRSFRWMAIELPLREDPRRRDKGLSQRHTAVIRRRRSVDQDGNTPKCFHAGVEQGDTLKTAPGQSHGTRTARGD